MNQFNSNKYDYFNEKYWSNIFNPKELNIIYLPQDVKITRVIFNPPATIVFWSDGDKTIVKDTDNRWEKVQKANKSKKAKQLAYWKETGILNAIAKKFYKNYQDVIAQYVLDDNESKQG